MANSEIIIAFQGAPGANSDMACRAVFPEMKTLPCDSFENAFEAVASNAAKYAMIPIDNSVAGRVADIHHLMPKSGLYIIGEHFQRVNHHFLAVLGTEVWDVTHVHSHVHALNQCKKLIRELGIKPVVHADTAGAARDIAAWDDKSQAALGSSLAADLYGLNILRSEVEDSAHNTTRFVIMSRELEIPPISKDQVVTSFVFRVRNVPAALYKAMGGFATNGVNMTKLESYVDEDFIAAQFYADVDGHPDDEPLKLALDELRFYTDELAILGTYPAHPFRLAIAAGNDSDR